MVGRGQSSFSPLALEAAQAETSILRVLEVAAVEDKSWPLLLT